MGMSVLRNKMAIKWINFYYAFRLEAGAYLRDGVGEANIFSLFFANRLILCAMMMSLDSYDKNVFSEWTVELELWKAFSSSRVQILWDYFIIRDL